MGSEGETGFVLFALKILRSKIVQNPSFADLQRDLESPKPSPPPL